MSLNNTDIGSFSEIEKEFIEKLEATDLAMCDAGVT
jgi:hypothetical protein